MVLFCTGNQDTSLLRGIWESPKQWGNGGFHIWVTRGHIFKSAWKFNIEPNGGIVDVSPKHDLASPNVKTPITLHKTLTRIVSEIHTVVMHKQKFASPFQGLFSFEGCGEADWWRSPVGTANGWRLSEIGSTSPFCSVSRLEEVSLQSCLTSSCQRRPNQNTWCPFWFHCCKEQSGSECFHCLQFDFITFPIKESKRPVCNKNAASVSLHSQSCFLLKLWFTDLCKWQKLRLHSFAWHQEFLLVFYVEFASQFVFPKERKNKSLWEPNVNETKGTETLRQFTEQRKGAASVNKTPNPMCWCCSNTGKDWEEILDFDLNIERINLCFAHPPACHRMCSWLM